MLNVDVEEIPTGEFSVSGGYSTSSGWMAELSVSERNLLGQGQYARFAVQYGQYARGFELSFAEPYFMGNRLGVGLDLYAKQTLATNYISYNSQTLGVATRAGFALSEELSFQARYNIYSQKISLPFQYNDCQFSPNALIQGGTGVNPTKVRMKVWADGQGVPANWQYTATDAADIEAPGAMGLMAYAAPGVTNGPLTASFDDLRAMDAK